MFTPNLKSTAKRKTNKHNRDEQIERREQKSAFRFVPDDLEMSEGSDIQDNIDQLRPQFLNLMNEFADAEMFLIDGDSLLMEQALDKNLDWTCSGQLLHLVYLFERYLHLFVRKGGVFEIVFFQDLGKMWKTQTSIHLARNVIIEHLKANVTHKILCEFESPWDMKFQKYIEEFAPSFMLLSDGLMSRNSNQNFIHKDAPELFEHHFLQVLSLKLNIAFTNPIEFGTSTLNGFHIMYERKFSEWEIPETNPILQ
ncbi:probable ATP-dependent RNA helicase DDX60 isoform X1 [Xenia sp. Carnegie-2017]|uniref:probable ATP-dependent RNA helicase DDX60 isoform X1 n=1 Tax=Xenia sp. Carnegie-2017 TaxID=2897299 RepID=UPI001F047F44|nr:probable ATP-dependent RNA helicase DDX60 isoform X1 [Xenia sp. Carnegie-2017]